MSESTAFEWLWRAMRGGGLGGAAVSEVSWVELSAGVARRLILHPLALPKSC
ncbi:MAG: hypothetical protein FWD57_13075 [Polyangiaceae bacterium]|nr:hypothetical protein [Polyangiaceae bacterium]